MKKWLLAIVMVWITLQSSLAYAIKVTVGGATVSAQPDVPTGVCTSGTFNMISGGNFVMTEANTSMWSGIGETENAYDGFGYIWALDAGNTARLYQYNLTTISLTGLSVVVDVANVPDAINSQQSSRYNTFTKKWVNSGLAAGVIHVRTYANGSLDQDINTGLAVTALRSTSGYDATSTFFSVQQGGNEWLYVMNTGLYTLAQSVNNGANTLSGASITSDSTYIYGLFNPNVIQRFDKTNVAVNASFPIAGLTTVSGITYYNGFLYVTGITGGVNAIIHKVDVSTMASVANVVFGGVVFGAPLIDAANSKIYIPSRSAGTSQLIRMGLSSFAVEQTYNGLNSTNGTDTDYTMLDTARQWVFMESLGGGGFVNRMEKVSLCSP